MRFKALLFGALAVIAGLVFSVHDISLFQRIGLVLIGLAALDSLSGTLGGPAVLAATGGSFANLTAGLKRRYDDSFLGIVTWSKGPLAAMIRKKQWSGEFAPYMMRVGNSPARSATYSTAANKSEDTTYGFTKVKQAQVPWVTDYGRATIAGLLMATASDKMGTVYDKFVAQIDGVLDAAMHSFSTKIYRDGFGSIGNIDASTNLATATLILAVKEDAVLYEQGMDIQFAQTNATSTLRNSGAVLTVTQIGGGANFGQLTTNAVLNTVTGISTGDFIFASGDRQNSATPTKLAIQGLDAWLPTAAPGGGENFNNLGDRNNDFRLLGTVVDAQAQGYSEEESLIIAAGEAARFGGKPRSAFFNPTRYENLIIQGQGRFRPTTVKGPMGIGFDGVTVQTNYGDIDVYPDPFCPRKRAFVVEMDSWTVWGAGNQKIPDFLTWDGNKILRQTADDGVECRVGYYAASGTNAPIHNVVIKFET